MSLCGGVHASYETRATLDVRINSGGSYITREDSPSFATLDFSLWQHKRHTVINPINYKDPIIILKHTIESSK